MRVTLLSNGHGEDAVGALLAREFCRQRPGALLQAFPTVDEGMAYERAGVRVLGPRRAMPSGGLLLHDAGLLLRDLRAGFLPMTVRQARELRRVQSELLVVIGDVYALALSTLARPGARYYVQPLISVHHREARQRQWHRRFMEEYTGVELGLIRRTVAHTYVRDAATAAYLRELGVRQVSALGNPMLDGLDAGARPSGLAPPPPVVALLPGSRAYAAASLGIMLGALERWPEATGLVAWAAGPLGEIAAPGWRTVTEPPRHPGLLRVLGRGDQRVYVLEGRFSEVLHAADLVLGTAGTANEQAAALGRPVVAFPLPPYYTPAFLANQKRLLADALTVTSAQPQAIAAGLEGLWRNPEYRRYAGEVGRARMGEPGGTAAIVADILRRAEG